MPGNLGPPPPKDSAAFDDWLNDLYEFLKYPVWGKLIGAASDVIYYFGDAGTDGSWRITRSGDDLQFDRRESGSWVNKGSFTAV